jgi:hypothetical protein
LGGLGVVTAGLLRSDGAHLLSANMPYLTGRNLKSLLENKTGAPVAIENDANAGAIAEWSVLGVELLYWAFGGGWGGAWADSRGRLPFPALDWDGRDESLHYTAEPGYALPLEKDLLGRIFRECGASFERFMQLLGAETGIPTDAIHGPSGRMDSLRAEAVLSGPGRRRLYLCVAGEKTDRVLPHSPEETRALADPAQAGRIISALSARGDEAARRADRLFGLILAEAARLIFERARADGLSDQVPICLGGMPSLALPFFGPAAQTRMLDLGLRAWMRPSVVQERGGIANLAGAVILARRVAGMAE